MNITLSQQCVVPSRTTFDKSLKDELVQIFEKFESRLNTKYIVDDLRSELGYVFKRYGMSSFRFNISLDNDDITIQPYDEVDKCILKAIFTN